MAEAEIHSELAKLPPNKQAIAKGVALWLNGWSINQAATEVGIGKQTMFNHLRKANLYETDRIKFASIIEKQALILADDAFRLQREKLLQDGHKLSAAELNMIWGTAADKLVKLQQINAQQHDGIALDSLLEKLSNALDGKRVNLSIEDAEPTTIDITPS
jgi:hypothetical protein